MTSVRAEKADTIAAALRPLIYLQHTSTIPHSRIDADKWEKQTLPHLSSCDRLNSGASAPPKDFADPFHVHRPRSPFVTGLFITPGPHTVPRASAADGWVRALVGATRAEINSPERSVYRPAIRKIKRREESREGGKFFTARSKAHASISAPSQSLRLLFSSGLSNPSAARGREPRRGGHGSGASRWCGARPRRPLPSIRAISSGGPDGIPPPAQIAGFVAFAGSGSSESYILFVYELTGGSSFFPFAVACVDLLVEGFGLRRRGVEMEDLLDTEIGKNDYDW
jgi:hypothetical protein